MQITAEQAAADAINVSLQGKDNLVSVKPGKPVVFIDIERYKSRVFFTLPRSKWGNRVKVTDTAALQAYFKQRTAEETQAKIEKERKKAEKEGRAFSAGTERNGADENEGGTKMSAFDAVSSTKRLINPKEPALKAITDYLGEVQQQLIGDYRGIAAQSSFMRGVYSVKRELVGTPTESLDPKNPKVEPILTEAKRKLREELLPALRESWDGMIENARTKPILQGGLGPLFNRDDYPTADYVASRFAIDSFYMEIGVSSQISEELRKQKQAEFELKVQNALDESINALREGFAGLIDHAIEKLTVEPGAKAKTFRDTLVGNIQDFIATFNAKDFGDEQLSALVEKAQRVLNPDGKPLDPDRLRKFANVRDGVASQFKAIQTVLDGMIVERKGRKIDLSEEE